MKHPRIIFPILIISLFFWYCQEDDLKPPSETFRSIQDTTQSVQDSIQTKVDTILPYTDTSAITFDTTKALPETAYPYTYYVLSESDWKTRNKRFQQINTHDSLSLNKFGFVEGSVQLNEIDSFDADLVIQTVDGLTKTYKEFMGIPDDAIINAEEELRSHYVFDQHGLTANMSSYFYVLNEYRKDDFFEEAKAISKHYFWLPQNQVVNSVMNRSQIHFEFDESNMTTKIGCNWYPEVFVPSFDIYSEEEAVEIALKFALNQLKKGYGGRFIYKEIYKSEKVFIPIPYNDKIQMHESWFFSIPIDPDPNFPDYRTMYLFEIYVDTQTSEVLSSCIIMDDIM